MVNKIKFCTILRERSLEHKKAITLMLQNELYGQAISILRQELDSMVRVIFLIEEPDFSIREHYVEQTLENVKWTLPNSRSAITDRQMVELSNLLFGWTKSVYKLGCAFIHLSPMSNYRNENPFLNLDEVEIQDIKNHLHNYHGFPLASDLNMDNISPYLNKVFTKVSDNLEAYIENFENDAVGDI